MYSMCNSPVGDVVNSLGLKTEGDPNTPVNQDLLPFHMRVARTQRLFSSCPLCLAPPPFEQDNGRFVSWPPVGEGYYVLHPDPITSANLGLAMQSGALFARKFDLEVGYSTVVLLCY